MPDTAVTCCIDKHIFDVGKDNSDQSADNQSYQSSCIDMESTSDEQKGASQKFSMHQERETKTTWQSSK